jgi:threonine/homoserine/homoserine lactone efflux protein
VVPLSTWLLFCVACAALAATPGPNLLYLVSRTLVQGRAAGFASLAGTGTGLAFHVLAAALGLSALLATVPAAYDAIRWAGAAYLAWLAWQTWRAPDTATPVANAATAPAPMARLYRDGVVTGILNPKVALFQLALFPQFVDPAHGSVLGQSLALGATQLATVSSFDACCVLAATGVRTWLAARPGFARGSKRVLAGIFAALAVRLAVEDIR